MSIQTEYYLSCDNHLGDGYCLRQSISYSSMSDAVSECRTLGWTTAGNFNTLDICPVCNGNNR